MIGPNAASHVQRRFVAAARGGELGGVEQTAERVECGIGVGVGVASTPPMTPTGCSVMLEVLHGVERPVSRDGTDTTVTGHLLAQVPIRSRLTQTGRWLVRSS